MEEINRQGMTPYSCRHTFLTRAIRSGMELPVLEAIVGHVDRETTKIYTHLHADDLVTAVQAMIEKPSAVRNKSVTRSEETEETIQKKFIKRKKAAQMGGFFGTPEGTRTPDLLIRSQSLYPTELLAHSTSLKC